MVELTAAQALRRGVAAHKEGNLYEAEKFYRAIVKSHQADPPAVRNAYNASDTPYSLDRPSDTPGNLDTSHNINVIAQTYGYLGAALQQKGDLHAAIECYKQAVKLKSDYSDVQYLLGHALRDKGDLQGSIACFQQIVLNDPDDADACINLGAALQHKGELHAVILRYEQVLKISPACAEAYNNLGSALQTLGELDAAIANFEKAININPGYVNALNNLGNALQDKGDSQAALACFRRALKIAPDSTQTLNNLGNVLREIGEYEEAFRYFDLLKTKETNPANPQFWFNSESQALECLYILGCYSQFKERLDAAASSGDINLRLAAVSVFVSHQLKFEDPYPFCKNPLDFLYTGTLHDHVANVDDFVEDLILEASSETQLWEPRHGVTKFGYQSSPTIFKAGRNCEALEKIIRNEIAAYYSRFASAECEYIKQWPDAYVLRGWFCRLLKKGHQQPHNHPSGWLSGVVYLKTLDLADSDAGAIELSLHGHDLPILDAAFARKIHRPQRGDIILFPSSLFHRTIPFNEDMERCVIAFDLYRY